MLLCLLIWPPFWKLRYLALPCKITWKHAQICLVSLDEYYSGIFLKKSKVFVIHEDVSTNINFICLLFSFQEHEVKEKQNQKPDATYSDSEFPNKTRNISIAALVSMIAMIAYATSTGIIQVDLYQLTLLTLGVILVNLYLS